MHHLKANAQILDYKREMPLTGTSARAIAEALSNSSDCTAADKNEDVRIHQPLFHEPNSDRPLQTIRTNRIRVSNPSVPVPAAMWTGRQNRDTLREHAGRTIPLAIQTNRDIFNRSRNSAFSCPRFRNLLDVLPGCAERADQANNANVRLISLVFDPV